MINSFGGSKGSDGHPPALLSAAAVRHGYRFRMERIGLEPGTELGGYRILAPLGAGAMGAVHRAVDGGGSQVALKLLHPHVVSDPDARERLRREAAALRRVRHPGLAQVLDLEIDSSEAFLVTELIDGPDLDRWVQDRGPLTSDHLADVAERLRSAVRAVHAAGVVHRDIKPSNVLLTPEGPVLIDFGIAFADDDARVTRTGFVVGTPGYVAPELLDGAEASPTTDWWGWAATLAFAATGRPPFGERPLEVVLARVRSGAPDLAGLDPDLAWALASALVVDPQQRTPPEQVVQVLRGESVTPGGSTDDGRAGPQPGAATAVLPVESTAGHPTADTAVLPPIDTTAVPPPAASAVTDAPVTDTAVQVTDTAVQPEWQPEQHWVHDPQRPAPPPWAPQQPWPTGDSAEPWPFPPAPSVPTGPPVAPRRTGTLLALLTVAAVAGASHFLLTGVAVVAGLLIAHATGLGVDALHVRRLRRGPRRSDLWRSVLLAPWYLLRALVGVLPGVVVGVSAAVITAGLLWWPIATERWELPVVPELVPNLMAGLAVVVGAVAAWFAPLARPTRAGARWVLRWTTPRRRGAAGVLVVLLLVAAALLATVVLTPGTVEWWPGRSAGLSEGLVPWS